MKKLLVIAMVFAATFFTAEKGMAQTTAEPGDNIVSAGIGFIGGLSYTGYSGISQTPSLSVYYERVYKQIGPGRLGLGGGLEYKSVSYDYGYGGYSAKWTYTRFAVRGTYHPDFIKVDKLDVYGGVAVGFENISYKDSYYSAAGISNSNYGSGLFVSALVGARYYFTPKFAAFSEVGNGLTYIKIGASYKF